jgi:hypothetical protein
MVLAAVFMTSEWAGSTRETVAAYVNTAVLILTLGVLAVTCVAIVEQVDEMQRVYPQIKTQADISLLSQRAWISPLRVSLINPDDVTEKLQANITVQNVGHEPARKIRSGGLKSYITTSHVSFRDWTNLPFWDNYDEKQVCANVMRDREYTRPFTLIYPNATATIEVGNYDDTVPPPGKDRELLKSEEVMFIPHGCFVFETIGKTVASAYCYILIPDKTKDISQWNFGACPVGNSDFELEPETAHNLPK